MVNVAFDDDDKWQANSKKHRLTKKNRSLKNNIVYSRLNTSSSHNISSDSNHVLIKITGGAISTTTMKNHFSYISRNNKLDITDDNDMVVPLSSVINDVADEMEHDIARQGAKKTYQMVFSTPGKNETEVLRKVVSETMKEQFPGASYYIAIHQDTKNTHAHVVLLRRTKDKGKRLEINKRNLNALKRKYSVKLNENGIKSYFLSETDKQRAGLRSKNTKRVDKRQGNDEYTVIDFGHAKYKFNDTGKDSFYLMLRTRNGAIKEHWSLGLRDEIHIKDIKPGDRIKLQKTNKTEFVERKEKYIRSTWNMDKLPNAVQNKIATEFKVIDFGHAKYKFDAKGKDSFYLIMKDKYGNQEELWSKSLEVWLKSKNIKPGDMMDFNGKDLMRKEVSKLDKGLSL